MKRLTSKRPNLIKAVIAVYSLSYIFFACSTDERAEVVIGEDLPAIEAKDIKQHISVLASDEFEGRMPFTQGETKTIGYLTEQLKSIGLEPGNGSSYLQSVPLVAITSEPTGPMMFESDKQSIELAYRERFVALTRRITDRVDIKDSEVVFCGFGIVAPEYEWNDYEGVDMKGKTALVLVNDPGFGTEDSTFFKGNTMTYYGRWTYKYEEAARQGADGIIIVHNTAPAGYPWGVVRNMGNGETLYLQTEDNNASRCAFEGWIDYQASRELFEAANLSPDALGMARKPGFKPIPMGLKLSLSLDVSSRSNASRNVIAKVTGSERPNEYIIYSAHWDHIGINEPVNGDSIYNGALDNASGTAVMLEIARAFANMETKPKRSVVFLAVTVEEQGLLGSEYYAQNPVYPINETVANINMDGFWFLGPMKDLTIVGYGQSELDEYAEEAAKAQGRYIIPDPQPEKGFFFRSDHFNFAKVGIPALYASGESEQADKGLEWTKDKNAEWTQKHYHQPSDEYIPEEWNFEGMAKDAELLFDVGRKLADEAVFPNWKPGSEFKNIRDSYMN